MKNSIALKTSVFVGMFYSMLANALIIESSVSANIYHQVNGTYTNYSIGPQTSIESNGFHPELIKTSDETAGGGANTQLIADAEGHVMNFSYGATSWIKRYVWQPDTPVEEFEPFSYSSFAQVARTARITNDGADDVRLDFDYIINGGGISYYAPDFDSAEYASASFGISIDINNQSVWYSGGSIFGSSYTQEQGYPQLDFYGEDLTGRLSEWSHFSGEQFDTRVNFAGYQWDSRIGTMNLGVLKAGESLELSYRYLTSVSGNVTHCVPQADSETPVVGCMDVLAGASIGHGLWTSDRSALIDESTITAYSVSEPSPIYLFILGLLGCLIVNLRKRSQL